MFVWYAALGLHREATRKSTLSQRLGNERNSKSRNLSKQSTDFTDDEDLGLPKSLQNSPGDFSDGLEVTSGSRVGPGWGTSRHHSSCSDNSLLSLDSFSEAVEETASPQARLSGPADGRLSHQAAKHK